MENCTAEGYHWDGPDEELYHCRLPVMDQMENCTTEYYHWDGPDGELYHCRLGLGQSENSPTKAS